MRILHVIASLAPRYGGPPKACLEYCRELVRQGCDVAIYTTNVDGPVNLDVPTDAPVFRDGVETRFFPVQTPREFKVSLPLAAALRREIPRRDLVHIHSLYLFPSAIAAHYCRQFGVPYIIRPHGMLDPYIFHRHRWRKAVCETLFEWRHLNGARAIHYTTKEEERLASTPRVRTPGVVVPIGLDPAEYAVDVPADELFVRWPELAGRRLVLFLGRINFKKGLDLLVDAFDRLAKRDPDVHLVIAGPEDPDYAAQVRNWVRERGLTERITFTGMLMGRDKLAAFHAAELFVLPSYSENFAIATAEALACGVPVVISDRVNLYPDVAEAKAGIVVPCDAGAVERAIAALLEDRDLARSMGARGRALIEERFAWPLVGRQLLAVYERIIVGAARAAPTGNRELRSVSP